MKRILLLGIFWCTIAFESNAQNCVQDSLFCASIAYRGPTSFFRSWQKGTRLLIAYDEIIKNAATLLLDYNAEPQAAFGGYKNAVPALTFRERVLTLQAIDTVDNKIVLVFDCAGKRYKFLSNKNKLENVTLSSLRNATLFGPMDNMQGLVGKTVYTTGSYWLTLKDRGKISTVPAVSYKYYPVTITHVEQDKFHQYYVYFKPVNTEAEYFYIVGYETLINDSTREEVCNNRFDTKFSLCDPRNRYKNITEKMWRKIQSMEIAEGMTEEEVRLIINKPDEESELMEKGKKYTCWSYRNEVLGKVYRIFFEKGKVRGIITDSL
ncbi:MAG: hypothetical protein J0I41_23135 [Filimonas sp.]|nr:hypothetical protein [Filimonas sp.]